MNTGHAAVDLSMYPTLAGLEQEEQSDKPHPMALLLDEIEESFLAPQAGEIRSGTIVDKRPHELLVDIGFKSEGIVNGARWIEFARCSILSRSAMRCRSM